MVQLTRIYTRGGDKGKTSLGNGARVKKHEIRVEAIGAVDETNAAIGIARTYCGGEIEKLLETIQNDLFDVGADLCLPTTQIESLRITPFQIERVEAEIDCLNKKLEPLTSFVLPGGSKAAAFVHLARTIARRSERRVCTLAESEPINENLLRYLNRLSDLLFVVGRTLNDQGKGDVLWQPGKHQKQA